MKLFSPAMLVRPAVRSRAAIVSCLRAELSDAAIILILFALVFGPIIGLHVAMSGDHATEGVGVVAQSPVQHGPRS
jgi:hypothetical protein